jgi:OFA family oxalate/formate antiporter-like MFS transporter
MYVMFVLVAAGGLTMAASMAPIAKDFKIEKEPVELFGLMMPALVFALSLNRIFDGVGRPFFGWLSDQIGREYTMALAFVIGAGALYILSQSGTNPVTFVLVTALYFGVYGEIFSLFPATGRHLRRQIRRIQRRHALHGQRLRCIARTGGCRNREDQRLGRGIHDRNELQHIGGGPGARGSETAAGAPLRYQQGGLCAYAWRDGHHETDNLRSRYGNRKSSAVAIPRFE